MIALLFGLLLLQSPAPSQEPEPLYTVQVNGRPLPLHDFLQGSFGHFELARPAELEVRTSFDVRWVDIRPKSLGIVPVIGSDHASVRFRVQRPVAVTVEFNGDIKRVLHLFPYKPEVNPPGPDTPNVRYFGPGTHEPGLIELRDGETLYLAPGAWVKGNVRSEGARNITIRGRGILDGTFLVRPPGSGQPAAAPAPRAPGQPGTAPARRPQRNMIYLNRTEGARIEGITVFNSTAWTVNVWSSTGLRVDGVNVLNPSVNYGNDGFDLVSSSDVIVENVFVRTNDYCVVVKNLADLETRGIVVRNAVFWNMPTGGNAVEIGFELRKQKVHDIRFENIDIIHVERGAAISIHNNDSAIVENVTFEDIRVEDVRRKLIDFAVLFAQYGLDRPQNPEERQRRMDRGGAWDGLQRYSPEERPERAKFRGYIRNIRVKNLHVVEGPLPYSVIAGFDADHAVENITIENLRYQGRKIRNLRDGRFSIDHARGIRFQ